MTRWSRLTPNLGFRSPVPVYRQRVERVASLFFAGKQNRQDWDGAAASAALYPDRVLRSAFINAVQGAPDEYTPLREVPEGQQVGLLRLAVHKDAPVELLHHLIINAASIEVAGLAALNPNVSDEAHELFATRDPLLNRTTDGGSQNAEYIFRRFLATSRVGERAKAKLVRRDPLARLTWLELGHGTDQSVALEVNLLSAAGEAIPSRLLAREDLSETTYQLAYERGGRAAHLALASNKATPVPLLARMLASERDDEELLAALLSNPSAPADEKVRRLSASPQLPWRARCAAFASSTLPLPFAREAAREAKSVRDTLAALLDPRLTMAEVDNLLPNLASDMDAYWYSVIAEGWTLPPRLRLRLREETVWSALTLSDTPFRRLVGHGSSKRFKEMSDLTAWAFCQHPDAPTTALQRMLERKELSRSLSALIIQNPKLTPTAARSVTNHGWQDVRIWGLRTGGLSTHRLAEMAVGDRASLNRHEAFQQLLIRLAESLDELHQERLRKSIEEERRRIDRAAATRAAFEQRKGELVTATRELLRERKQGLTLLEVRRSLKVPAKDLDALKAALVELGIHETKSGRYLPRSLRLPYARENQGYAVARAMQMIGAGPYTCDDIAEITGLTPNEVSNILTHPTNTWAEQVEHGLHKFIPAKAKALLATPPPYPIRPSHKHGYANLTPAEATVVATARSIVPVSLDQIRTIASELGVPNHEPAEYRAALTELLNAPGVTSPIRKNDDRYELNLNWVAALTHCEWMELAIIAQGRALSSTQLADQGALWGRDTNPQIVSSAAKNSRTYDGARFRTIVTGTYVVHGFIPDNLDYYAQQVARIEPHHDKFSNPDLATRTGYSEYMIRALRKEGLLGHLSPSTWRPASSRPIAA